MSWRDAFLHPRREQGKSRPARTPARAVGLETFAVSELARDDAGALGLHADPDGAIHAEMAVMAARAAERAREEELDNDRVSMMVPRHRLEYRRMRWEAVNAAKLSGMSPQKIEQEYDAFRLAQWEQQNADRIAQMGPGERQESFRSEELLTRYRAGLPARDDEEREAYREWRQLDADAVNAYREEVEIPEQLWDEYVHSNGPLNRDEFFAQYFEELTEKRTAGDSAESSGPDCVSSPGAEVAEPTGPLPGGVRASNELGAEFPDADASPSAVRLSGLSRAGSGLEDGPMSPLASDGAAPRGGDAPDAGPPLLIPPGDPGAAGQVRPGYDDSPSGPALW